MKIIISMAIAVLLLYANCKNEVNNKNIKLHEKNLKQQKQSKKDKSDKFLSDLLMNFTKKKITIEEVKNTKKYENFRKSKYFQKFLLIAERLKKGIKPKNKSELLQHLFSLGEVYPIIDDPSPGRFKFNEDGTFIKEPGEFYGRFYTGKWRIEDSKSELVLVEEGIIVIRGYAENVLKDKNLFNNPIYNKNKNLIWLKKYKKPIVERIKLRDIELRRFHFHFYNLYEYNVFGDIENNKIIDGKIGKYIRDYNEI